MHYLIQFSQQLRKINLLLLYLTDEEAKAWRGLVTRPSIQVNERQSQDSSPGLPGLPGGKPVPFPQAGPMWTNRWRRRQNLYLHWKKHSVHITDSKDPSSSFVTHYITSEYYTLMRHRDFKSFIHKIEWRVLETGRSSWVYWTQLRTASGNSTVFSYVRIGVLLKPGRFVSVALEGQMRAKSCQFRSHPLKACQDQMLMDTKAGKMAVPALRGHSLAGNFTWGQRDLSKGQSCPTVEEAGWKEFEPWG